MAYPNNHQDYSWIKKITHEEHLYYHEYGHKTVVPQNIAENAKTLRWNLKKWREHNIEIFTLYAHLVNHHID